MKCRHFSSLLTEIVIKQRKHLNSGKLTATMNEINLNLNKNKIIYQFYAKSKIQKCYEKKIFVHDAKKYSSLRKFTLSAKHSFAKVEQKIFFNA